MHWLCCTCTLDLYCVQDERAARGRKVVRLDSCRCFSETYVPLVNANHEEEPDEETESHVSYGI